MMDAGFDEAWATSAVGQLARKGVEFANGLDDEQLAQIGEAFGVHVPDELALFLRAGVPTSPGWARWTDGAQLVLESTREWIERAFAFDVESGQYWHPLLGVRPPDVDDAVSRALAVVRSAPPLIPIYGHRFIATHVGAQPRAVLSVWQANDSVFCGYDLADYLACEFGIDRPEWAADEPPPVPVWEDLFDLFCTSTTAAGAMARQPRATRSSLPGR